MNTQVWMSVVSSVCIFVAASAQAEDCKHRLHFLPVLQPMEGENGVIANLESAAKVQFDIAHYLAKHKDLPVFSEQVWSDKSMKATTPEFEAAAKEARSSFPSGLPAKYEQLTKDQKILLTNAGGDTVNLILGTTPLLRRTMEDEKSAETYFGKIQKWMEKNPSAQEPSPEIESLMFEKRDALALDQVNEYFAANPTQKDAALVFGIEHLESFQRLESKFPSRCIVLPFEFQSVKSPDEEAEERATGPAAGSGGQRSAR